MLHNFSILLSYNVRINQTIKKNNFPPMNNQILKTFLAIVITTNLASTGN